MTEDIRILAGRYKIGRLLGRGGMADVHEGTDTRLGRRVAIKLLKPSLALDPNFRLLFREEAQKAARMAHPTIVRVYDAGEETVADANGFETQLPFIVMEHVDGRLLKDIIADGPMEPKQAVKIVDGILTALEFSHRALLVHRDIKPGNVMVTQNGQVKVMDFGIARAVSDNSATVADTSTILGTAQYFSPEQAKGETVDARTDLYSTGVVLFELLTGRPPFRGERAAAVAYQHISEQAPRPGQLNPAVSPALDAVVLHALTKDKGERFQTASEFREELELAASGEVPKRKVAAPADFDATLFGVNPASAGGTATVRQLSSDTSERAVRTQNRPPVAWIWSGVVVITAVLIALTMWVINLNPISLGEGLSVEVPDIVGTQYEDGAKILQDKNLLPTRLTETSETVPQGKVIRTVPSAGVKVPPEEAVKVYVSQGKALTTVPRLANLSEEAAKAALAERGLVYGSTTPSNSSSIAAGTVISSDPAGGDSVQEGDVVNLVVSSGLVDVPQVTGMPVDDANETLTALNLPVTLQEDTSCTGRVVSHQSLAVGTHPIRSPITITYCNG